MTNYYSVPEAIADSLKMTDCRHRTEDGSYILNGGDLVSYGVDKAVEDGAREISESEARNLIKQSNNR